MKIPFTVSARTARLIGRDNVSNAEGAVIELIKNSYDADASKVILAFVKNDLIFIDNGHGMSLKTIKDYWMTIGTDNKSVKPLSPNYRIKAGAKGIGRFALDRLGKKVAIFTKSAESDALMWKINWADFEKETISVSEVNAELEEIKKFSFSQEIEKINPNYNNLIDISDSGTIIKISNLTDEWTKEDLDNLYRNLEMLVPSIENDSFSIILQSDAHEDEYGKVEARISQDYDYKIDAEYKAVEGEIQLTIHRNELDIGLLEKNYNDVFSLPLMQEYPFDLETFKKGSFKQVISMNTNFKKNKYSHEILKSVGDFKFSLIYAKITAPNKEDFNKYPYKTIEYSSRSNWLKKFGGVKIFRDNFRVRPYGEEGQDWLKLGERAAQSPAGAGSRLGGFKVRPNQLTGAVYISRLNNLLLEDKSSREGILENLIFSVFKEILIYIIELLEKDRNIIFYSLSELDKKRNESERIKAEGKEAAKRVNNDNQNVSDQNSTEVNNLRDDAKKLAKAVTVLENENEVQHEEIKILRSLASAGLITAAVAHELRGLKNILLVRNNDLRDLLKPYINQEMLEKISPAYNPYVLLDDMEKTDKTLHEWISYALTPLKRDKRQRKKIILADYFEDLSSMWKHLLAERLIDLSIHHFSNDYFVRAFVIDLDTIFNNLIINSIESFSKVTEKRIRKINISVLSDDNYLKIKYADNGVGLDPIYKERPETIYLPQETTKLNNGTGMGMYLVKSVIDDNSGKIEILKPNQGFSVVVYLPINKN